mgnify:CR=1 FL=1
MTECEPIQEPATSASFFRQNVLAIFTVEEIQAEIKALRTTLELDENPESLKLDNDEWEDIINDLVSCLGPILEGEGLNTWNETATDRDRAAVAQQIHRALSALDAAKTVVDDSGSPTGLLLPVSFARRVDKLLGFGELPVAWVRTLAVTRYE